jgi:ElaB/YqjD/DUF883 family membrane-anchored ribosome-binding protein
MGEEPTAMRPDIGATPVSTTDDPAAIRAEIEQTRAEMSETIDAIQDKLSPQRMMEQAKETVRDATVGRMKEMATSATETASDLAEQVQDSAQQAVRYVRENPLPALLIGAGAAWLLMRWQRGEPRLSYPQTRRRPSESSTREMTEKVQERWQYYSTRAETQFDRWMRENPLTVGAAAVAIGAAVGLSAPRTETEDEWMGEARDTLIDRAQEVAQDTVQQVQQAQGAGGQAGA